MMRESTNGLEEREYRAPFFVVIGIVALVKNFFHWLVTDGLIFLAIGAVTAGVVVVKVLIKKKNARLMMEEKIRQAEKDTIKLASRRSGYLTAVDLRCIAI
ncbi:hypothetical protein NDS46_05405 [Paenibacillus thiaminolyticus]|uniref:hypothetical protein n=1 Tax=Paenibacillus thiaminolyticus TaxID=49283 RepID=UPI00232D8680|nr:hypothetical protein [Paenibacillus thiaminolyticus]WCF09335.1 hypothetical protein NDS46_05405 [Paenibacillus thiaminolyticus]